ncbi:nucleotidyltransferase domain-containing protein [Methylocaldum sp.]|uniref:nucleotidyltransferase domain-containing protein n=1 Tax=Methylocaldum sp. TaxID=1969727 RepID=UPI002D5E7340|nr:nucleotidyltransferase domain-containing protein [Methylocaldum sp.]HYE37799.1 nucleotidyltransferase domain-containing protein [Methylocaldum sp.]
MRVSNRAIKAIVEAAKSVAGSDASVWLFGSRVNENARGGDIDLFVESQLQLENRVAAACQIGAKIQMTLGEQRVDVIVKDRSTKPQAIHDIAKNQGIRLC